MTILTEQEIREAHEKHSNEFLFEDTINFARAIESAVIEKIKAQGAVAWLHRDRPESVVVTTKFKHVWGEAVVGSLAMYDIPLYHLPEREKE